MKRPAELPDLMTVDEVAAVMRINRRTLLNRRSQGLAPAGYRVGKQVLFPRADVHRYLEQQAANDLVGARAS